MGNLKTRKTVPTSTTYPEWLKVSAAIGRAANEWSGRFDIAAFAGPIAGQGNPACYSPHTGELEINSEICFGEGILPVEVETLDELATQFEWPRATGAIFHEAMHARYSLWDIANAHRTLSPEVFNTMLLLEEGRIEKQGLEIFPRMSGFLRTTALEIVLQDLEESADGNSTMFAANVAALSLARVDAGSLEASDVESIREVIAEKFGAETLEKLRELWIRAQDCRNHVDFSELQAIATEWVEIVREAAKENGEEPGSDGQPGEGSGSDEGSGTGTGSGEFSERLVESIKEAAEEASIGAYGDLADAELSAEYEEISKARSSASSEKKRSEDVASDVFGSGTAEVNGTSSASTISEKRKPTPAERAAAVRIANMIDKAKYRERSETEINDIVPPGRLRSRAAVQAAALKSKGMMSQVDTWRRTVRKHTDDPTLSIGVMVDISGSMGGAMQQMASTAWIMSEAARRAEARAAMVYYGNDVFSTLKPGQHLDQVRVWSAPDMTEKFDKAFKALNGGLGLLHGSGVRMLVIVSDGEYTGPETNSAKHWLARCAEAGVAVIWIDNSMSGGYSSYGARTICNGTKAERIPLESDPTAAAVTIGQAAARALAAVA